MAEPIGDNQNKSIEDAVQQFVHARSRGREPDIDEFVKQYPELENQLRQRLENLEKIDSLFDSLVQADEDDFEDTAIRDNLVGQKLRDFEIVKVIGRGGMGVVYLAHDTRLKRSVAVKSIPAALAGDSTARMRFKREAELLASLNHPNIAVIHDIIEQKKDTGYLVLEYVPGQTLAQRIAHKPLKLQEALSIGRQIAEAVAAAHEKGIVHRDLKPGNIKLTPEGRVKVLDFGLAKPAGDQDQSKDSVVTQAGSIIGTPAYMSPEQIRGGSTDSRTDIWSFGCIIYEMLTGKRPFEGKTVSDTVAHALEHQPEWQALPQQTPANIKTLLRRCLEKDPLYRLQHIGDAAIEISETLNLPAVAPPVTDIKAQTSHSPNIKRLKIIGTICLFLLGTCTGFVILRYIKSGPEAIRPIYRYIIRPPAGISMEGFWKHAMALSPDGRQLVHVCGGQSGSSVLYLHDMDDIKSKPLQGTEGAGSPFFSPDGQWIGFCDFTRGELKKIASAGGPATSLCKTEQFLSGCWCPDDTIIFSIESGELWCFTASKGMKNLTIPDPNQHRVPLGHMCPKSLPDGEQVLFTNRLRKDNSRMELISLRTGKRRILFQEDGTDVRYVPTGHLVFARDDTLFAVPFDIDKLKVKGLAQPVPVVEGIHVSLMGPAQYTFSENGTLAYMSSLPRKRRLVWVDRQGVVQPVGAPSKAYQSVRVSPDGNRLAVTIAPKYEDDADIWILDKARPTPHQLTFSGDNRAGIWTPDGKRVIYTHISGWKWLQSSVVPMSILADGSGEPEMFADASQFSEKPGLHFWGCRCLSTDGRYLLGGTNNIWVLPMEPNANLWPFIIRNNSFQRHPSFSPNGKWVAYDSDETGRTEVYVCPFPGPGGIILISTEGGGEPIWSPDGKELFYRCGNKMMAVTIEIVAAETGPELKAGTPMELFKGQFFSAGVESVAGLSYDLDSDGRFIMIQEDEEAEIHVVLNWFEELKRLVPIENK